MLIRCLVGALVVSSVLSTNASAQQEMPVIEIGMLSTTHLVFTSDLTYVDISSQDVIAAKVVDASKNMLALKARKEFDFVTTISALETNGTMHTFKVRFNSFPQNLVVDTRTLYSNQQNNPLVNTQVRPQEQPAAAPVEPQKSSPLRPAKTKKSEKTEPAVEPASPGGITVSTASTSNFGRVDAPTLEEVMKLGQQVYHIGDRNYKLEAYCVNVFVYSNLTYFIISLKNGSGIGYEAGEAQFTVETRHKGKRNLATDKTVWPKSSYGTLSCAPGSETKAGYTVPKLTLLENEVLKIYIYEKGGNRNLILTLTDKDINYAVSPK